MMSEDWDINCKLCGKQLPFDDYVYYVEHVKQTQREWHRFTIIYETGCPEDWNEHDADRGMSINICASCYDTKIKPILEKSGV